MNGGFIRKTPDKWSIFHCHGWLLEGNSWKHIMQATVILGGTNAWQTLWRVSSHDVLPSHALGDLALALRAPSKAKQNLRFQICLQVLNYNFAHNAESTTNKIRCSYFQQYQRRNQLWPTLLQANCRSNRTQLQPLVEPQADAAVSTKAKGPGADRWSRQSGHGPVVDVCNARCTRSPQNSCRTHLHPHHSPLAAQPKAADRLSSSSVDAKKQRGTEELRGTWLSYPKYVQHLSNHVTQTERERERKTPWDSFPKFNAISLRRLNLSLQKRWRDGKDAAGKTFTFNAFEGLESTVERLSPSWRHFMNRINTPFQNREFSHVKASWISPETQKNPTNDGNDWENEPKEPSCVWPPPLQEWNATKSISKRFKK